LISVVWRLKKRRLKFLEGFPARKCATQPDQGAEVQKGKKLILFSFACDCWRTWRVSSSLILYLGGIFSGGQLII
jgi:hypothetical protein